MPELDAAEFHPLGVYDPAAPNAARRLELLEYLVSLGTTAEDLVEYRDKLPGVAGSPITALAALRVSAGNTRIP